MTDGGEQKRGGKNRGDVIRYLGVASTVGINLVVCTFVGFAIGFWVLDRYFGTFPLFTIVFLVLGIAAGFRYLFKIGMRQKDNGDSEGST